MLVAVIMAVWKNEAMLGKMEPQGGRRERTDAGDSSRPPPEGLIRRTAVRPVRQHPPCRHHLFFAFCQLLLLLLFLFLLFRQFPLAFFKGIVCLGQEMLLQENNQKKTPQPARGLVGTVRFSSYFFC